MNSPISQNFSLKEGVALWKHQELAVKLGTNRSFGLFFEQGCGKTLTAISMLLKAYQNLGTLIPTLIVCPVIVVENWRKEFLFYSNLPPGDVIPLSGSGKKRLDTFLKSAYLPTGNGTDVSSKRVPKIFITNYKSLLMRDLFNAILSYRPEIQIFDESHRLKTYNSKTTKAAITLSDTGITKYILTGTPILKDPMDLFSQYRVMDEGKTFGKNFFVFRAIYFEDRNSNMPRHVHFPKYVPRRDSLDTIRKKTSVTSMTIKKKNCLDLPPLIYQKMYVEMSADQNKHYEEMKRDFITYVDNDDACVAHIALTKALRLQQIVSGFLPTHSKKEIGFKNNPRLLALREILEIVAVEA